MRKEFYIDNYNNFNFKTTFYPEDAGKIKSLPEYIPEEGVILHISVNKKILRDAIMAMANYRNSIHEVIMYADCSNTEIGAGFPNSVSLKRYEDLMLHMHYNYIAKDDEGEIHQDYIVMDEYLPFDVINFLEEFKD